MTTTDTRTPASGTGTAGVAQELADVVTPLFGGSLPVRIRAWDGSLAGPAGRTDRRRPRRRRPAPPGVPPRRARSRPGVRHRRDRRRGGPARRLPPGLAGGPRERRLPAAGRGDRAGRAAHRQEPRRVRASPRAARVPGAAPRPVALGQAGDRDAISHHYDLSNDFYALILDPHMAYSCAYFTSDDPGYTIEDAQRDKLDLVCRKLGPRHGRSRATGTWTSAAGGARCRCTRPSGTASRWSG